MKKYNRVIITDENFRPMAWSSHQLCYCDSIDFQDEQHPVTDYSIRYAKTLIKLSNEYRKQNNLSENNYKMMPFNPTH